MLDHEQNIKADAEQAQTYSVGMHNCYQIALCLGEIFEMKPTKLNRVTKDG